VATTDGPYTKTTEQLGSILVLEASDRRGLITMAKLGIEPLKRRHEWIGIAGAVIIGPIFVIMGNGLGLLFAVAAIAYCFVCLVFIPILSLLAGRFIYVAWQLAVFSMALSVIVENVWIRAMRPGEIPSVLFDFWAIGSIFSSPLPIFILAALWYRKIKGDL